MPDFSGGVGKGKRPRRRGHIHDIRRLNRDMVANSRIRNMDVRLMGVHGLAFSPTAVAIAPASTE
jgi:hypothetical protein